MFGPPVYRAFVRPLYGPAPSNTGKVTTGKRAIKVKGSLVFPGTSLCASTPRSLPALFEITLVYLSKFRNVPRLKFDRFDRP